MAFSDRILFTFARPQLISAAMAIVGSSGLARATWSILIADTRTGEIVIGSATCVESIDLQQETPVLISGVGAVTAQSAVDASGMNRQLIRDRLLQGVPLDAILEELALVDAGHSNRQYGFITSDGQTLTYSGVQNADWAGGQTGRIERGAPGFADDIVYTVQGNILAGSNVVQAAIDAIRASDGDLPAMMMAGMQAARGAGGDGRCSCSNANPTGCGSPPPGPFKSAHVGYMLGTRAGDIDAARAVYPTDELIGTLTTIDLDADGFEEVVVGSASSDTLWLYKNTAMPGDPLSSLQLAQTIVAPAGESVAMDVAGPNLMVAFANPPRMALYQPDGQGSIERLDSVDLLGTPVDFAQAQSDPQIRGVSLQGVNQIQFFRISGEAIELLDTLDLGFSPAQIVMGALVGDGFDDLAVCDPAHHLVHVYAGGEGGFALVSSIPTSNDPIKVQAADMDSDGDNEIIVLCGTGRRGEVYNLDSEQWTLWGSSTLFGSGIALAVGDMSGDGLPDLVSTYAGNNRNLQLFISDGLGGLVQQTRTRVGSGAKSVRLVDMNNNGNLDLVVGNGGSDGLMILDNAQGIDLPQPGRFAAGQYFMSFDIPNQRAGDPDPVDQLQQMYNDWLLTRQGRVDAVRSSVFGRGLIETSGSSTLRIELRDLNGNLLDISDPSQLELSIVDPVATLGEPLLTEPGVFEVELAAGDALGRSRLIVRAGPEGERVELMPAFPIGVVESLADFNADGVCNFFDVAQFIQAWIRQDANADLVTPFEWDFNDVAAFLQIFKACEPG